MRVFTRRLLVLRAALRALSGSPGRARVQEGRGAEPLLPGAVDRYGAVTVELKDIPLEDTSEGAFSSLLTDCVSGWKLEGRVAVWLHVPLALSRFAAAASTLGFRYHHAREDTATLVLWLADAPCRLPGYATHQVGVAGAVVDESNGKVVVVQDRNKTLNTWKFPGGLSDQGENIGCTAVREVLEETGVRSEFQSLLSVRQQHDHPGAFGMSDLYVICRLRPLSRRIRFCREECVRCEWVELAALAGPAHSNQTTPITARVARLLLHGLEHGFHTIDLSMEEIPAVHSGRFYQLYHRALTS